MDERKYSGFVPYKQWLHQHDEDIKADFPDKQTEDLANEYGVNYYTVSRRAARLGVGKSKTFMHDAWRRGALKGCKVKGDERKAFKASADGYMKEHFHDTANEEMARTFGVDVKTIRRWARRLGLQKSEAFMFASRSKAKKNKPYYTPEQIAWRNRRIAEVYPDGTVEQLQRLMEELGVGMGRLRDLAHSIGLERSREATSVAMSNAHDKTRKYSSETIAAVAEYYKFHSTKECAEKFGINFGTLKQIATHSGWRKDKEYKHRTNSERACKCHIEKKNRKQ